MNEHRRLAGDEGIAFVELAMVLPFLIFLVLGIFEFGTAWRNSTVLGSGLRSAVRIEAQSQDTFYSDLVALQSFQSSMVQSKNMTVTKVFIYNATSYSTPTYSSSFTAASSAGTSGMPSSNCLSASSPSAAPTGCNYYDATRLAFVKSCSPYSACQANFGSSAGCSGMYDEKYCPSARNVNLTSNSGYGPDLIGIYAIVTYKSMTKMLPSTMTVTDFSTARIEPRS